MLIHNLKLYEEYVEKGLLRKAEDEDLVQYNYSDYCNNNDCWDSVTLFNRGNIYEKKTGFLVAKAMPKFFNFSQLPEEQQKHFLNASYFKGTEKMDGCLGILYKYKGEVRFNSRNSFNNHVTDAIKRILPKYNMEVISSILDITTINVEVISPETHIICDYGKEENLYLLTAFSNLGSRWMERSEEVLDYFSEISGMPRPKYSTMTWEELFTWQKEADYQKEGFVITINSMVYDSFERVKLKSDDYLHLAKMKMGLNKHSIWKMMKRDIEEGTNVLDDYLSRDLPDEFLNEAQGYRLEIINDMNNISAIIKEKAKEVEDIPIEELSKYFKEFPFKYQNGIYSLRRNKPFDRMLIRVVEPKIVDIDNEF